jgi:large subunit ribosomal protein L32
MPVPKRKTCRWKRDQRRAHIKLRATGVVNCDNCGKPKRTHHVCDECGYYGGVLVQKNRKD